MRKEVLAYKVLCGLLAVSSFVLPMAAQANSGFSDETRRIPGLFGTYYIGSSGAADNVVVVDRDLQKEAGVVGGYAESGTIEGNSVSMTGGTVQYEICGAASEAGDGINNQVHMSGGTVMSAVYGAYLLNGNAANNSVSMSGGTVNYGIFGGGTLYGSAENNSVSINGGTVGVEVCGGISINSDAAGNRVSLSGGTVQSDICGGYSLNGNVTSNNVNMTDGTAEKHVHGGFTKKGNAVGNSVSMSGGTVGDYVTGGYAEKGNAVGNSVNLSGGTVGYYIIGGYAENGDARNNSVSVSGGTINYSIFGGSSGKSAENNSVSISGGTVNGNVHGGYSITGNDTGNSVSMSGGTVMGDIYGAYLIDGDAANNSVSMSGGTAQSDIYGGGTLFGSAENNRVNISGGTVKGTVYGGYAWFKDATGNSITLSGTADVSGAALYGGYAGDGGGTVSNNKLIINGWSGNVKSLNNFNGTDGGIEVQALAGGLELAAGKTTDFVFTEEGITNCDQLKTVENIQAGVALTVSGEIIANGNNLAIAAASVRASDQTAITTESRAAAAAFVQQGTEAVSDSLNYLQGAEAGISTFAVIGGNSSRYDTGSYAEVNGWNGIVGAAKTREWEDGKLSYGAFFENGSGNYNTYNEINGTVFRGDGNAVYNGGGLLLRCEKASGVYTEASLRAGMAKNEVSNALADADNNRYGYKTENAYYGAHIGIGKIIKLDSGKEWNVYGKYFHTHHEGDQVKIADDAFHFDAVDSNKLRIGVRFSENPEKNLAGYCGLAWEYEFSGEAGGTAAGHAMYTPSLEGSTVIGEIGVSYRPDKASSWYLNANIKGYAGMQEGISGSVQAGYRF